MNKALATLAVVIAAGLLSAPASASDAVSSADPQLRVKLVTPDGRPKVKVERKLKVLSSCSTACRMRVTMILRTPLGSTKRGGAINLNAGGIWTTWIDLNNFGLSYLKKNYTRSSLKVVARGRDFKTGQVVRKVRTFGFYR
jgi:hypothetical protein